MNHKDLDAWKQAMALVEAVYLLSRQFPREETYGLTVQLRRAAVSVPSNLSEGAARASRKELLCFLSYSLGSLAEMETQLLLAERLGYCSAASILQQVDQVRALLLGLRRGLQRSEG